MKRPKRDPIRDDRIYNEAIVDARPEEQAMSWYYYLEGKITFPFRARCAAANAVSPLRKGGTVEVLRMAVEDACEHDMLVQIRWQGRKMAVPVSQLEAINPDDPPSRPSATGITGLPKATPCNLRTATESSLKSDEEKRQSSQAVTLGWPSAIPRNRDWLLVAVSCLAALGCRLCKPASRFPPASQNRSP